MTRREDPVWGTDDDAARGNLDSMHMTNVVPQMQPFNAGIWLALEDYALDNAREDDMRISVFTGPILRPDDPERYGVKVPVEFWKVIAFIHDGTGNLCATGYKLSQKGFLRREEFVFGAHETTQVSIAWIEGQTKLKFGRLSDVDPLRRADEGREQPLTSFEQIRFTAGT
jgi:endonuclease G